MAASYKAAIAWIAENDEPGYLYREEILEASGLTIPFVADLFGKHEDAVAEAVSTYRIRKAWESK